MMNTRSILAFVSLLAYSLMASSQVTTPSNTFTDKRNTQDSIEIVTVGSTMPYKVTPFNWGSLQQYMGPSIFKWWLNGNANGYELLKSDGITPLTPLPPPNHVYYPDSSIAIHWVKTGKYRIRINENTLAKPNITLCDHSADIQTLDVIVVDRPSVAWEDTTTKSGCNLANSIQLAPILVKGSGQITITYDLFYTPQTGTTITQTGLTAIFNVLNNDTTGSGSIPINIPSGGYGTYEITIIGISDKMTAKCGIISQIADVPQEKYTITVLSALETSPIQFVKELE